MWIARAALVYFALVFATGFVLGPIRVVWIEPDVGPLYAVLIELPFLVAAMVGAARWVLGHWVRAGGARVHAAIGLGALFLQITADTIVGFGLRGLSLRDQLATFTTAPGAAYALALILFTAMPSIVGRALRAP